MDLQPPKRCGEKGEGDCQCNEMAAPGRCFCRKHSLEVKGLDERKRERKVVGGEEGSGCAKRMRMMSVEIGKKKVFGRSKGKDLLLFYEVKKGLNFEEGKEALARRKKGEKKRFFGDEAKEPARLNRNSSGSSRAEKTSGIARKKTSLLSKHKDFGGRTTKAEATINVCMNIKKIQQTKGTKEHN